MHFSLKRKIILSEYWQKVNKDLKHNFWKLWPNLNTSARLETISPKVEIPLPPKWNHKLVGMISDTSKFLLDLTHTFNTFIKVCREITKHQYCMFWKLSFLKNFEHSKPNEYFAKRVCKHVTGIGLSLNSVKIEGIKSQRKCYFSVSN